MIVDDVEVLRCPRGCTDGMKYSGDRPDEILTNGELGCRGCGTAWPVRDGVAHLLDERTLGERDQRNQWMYDLAAPVHDLAVTWILPFLQLKTEGALREAYMKKLELGRLSRSDGRIRILEVGVGTGANIPLVEQRLKPLVRPEFWALDVSRGMLERCRARHRTMRSDPIRYIQADAHALPFADATFDRVFHVGGIAGYSNPSTALAEMARVAKPGTPIVVVDEQLAKGAWLYQRIAFELLTLVAEEHGAPGADQLPPGFRDLEVEQISSFYYSLRFRMSGRRAEERAVMDPGVQRKVDESMSFALKGVE